MSTISVNAVRGRQIFRITVDADMTLRDFTRILQDKCVFDVKKRHMKLLVSSGGLAGPYTKFYSFRSRVSPQDFRRHDMSLRELGVADGTWMLVEWVFSAVDASMLGTAMVADTVCMGLATVATTGALVAAAGVATAATVEWYLIKKESGSERDFKYRSAQVDLSKLPNGIVSIECVH